MSSTKSSLQFLEELLITPSPTGFESAGQQVWLNYVKPFSDSVIGDPYGSAAAVLQVDSKAKTVVLEAHCDEIGMMINYISDQGLIHVTKIGGSDVSIVRAKKVFIHTHSGIVTGVVGNTAIHLQDKENQKLPKWADIFIDIGVSTKEEALQLVQIGDPITYSDDFEFLNDEIIVGRALDNRIGGYIIAEAFKALSEIKAELNVNVVAVNSVQEEIGGFGAKMMTHRIKPDFAIVTDVTHATDTPGINQKEHGEIKLGGGPSLTHGSANHPKLVQFLKEVAAAEKIEVQHEATSSRTGTDTDSIFFQNGGVVSALISLPLRYMHSPVEMASMEDVQGLIDLMVASVRKMKKSQDFTILKL